VLKRCCIEFGSAIVVVRICRSAAIVRPIDGACRLTCRTSVSNGAASVCSASLPANSSGARPGSMFSACSPITILPAVVVNTGIKLIDRRYPSMPSHGSHTL
jgi:hypothetical protein